MEVRSIFSVLRQQHQGARIHQLIKRNHPIEGKLDLHEFDVAVANGMPFLAAQGLSFEIGDRHALQREIDSTAWPIDDVKKLRKELPLAVVVLPPRKKAAMSNYINEPGKSSMA